MPFFFLSFFNVQKHKTIQKASPNQTKKPAAAIIIAVLLLEKPIFIWLLVYFFCARETKKWWRALHFSHKQQIKIIHIFTHITFAVYISYRIVTQLFTLTPPPPLLPLLFLDEQKTWALCVRVEQWTTTRQAKREKKRRSYRDHMVRKRVVGIVVLLF